MSVQAIIAIAAGVLIAAGILYTIFGRKEKVSSSKGGSYGSSGSGSATPPRDQKPS